MTLFGFYVLIGYAVGVLLGLLTVLIVAGVITLRRMR